jgi:hypothetical protein
MASKDMIQKGNILSAMKSPAIIVVVVIVSVVCCARLFKRDLVTEPVRIVIVDESRVDNAKVRHIFKEFLVKWIIDRGGDRITVVDPDSINSIMLQTILVDYLVVFDVMDFGTWDIEAGTEKILASVKIVHHYDNIILKSFTAGARADRLEVVCWQTAKELSTPVVKALIAVRKAEEKAKKMLSEPHDSL